LILTVLASASHGVQAHLSADDPCRNGQAVQELIQQGRDGRLPYAERKAAFERAIQLCPREVDLYDSLYHLQIQEHDFEEGLEWIRRGLELSPENLVLRSDEAVALLSVGQAEKSLAVLKGLPKSGQSQFYLGMAYRALRNPKAAQQAFSEAFSSGYQDPYVLYALIEQDHALHDKEAGLEHFQILSKRFPDSPWLHMVLGDAYMSRYEDSSAESEFKKVLELSPNLPVVHFQLGYLAFRRADYSRATEELRKEIACDPSLGEAYLYLGLSLRRLGNNDEALPLLKKAVALDPDSPLPYRALAVVQLNANQPAAASETLQTAKRRFPTEPAFPALLAALSKQAGRAQEAEEESVLAESLSRQGNPPHEMPGGAALTANPSNANEAATAASATAPGKVENSQPTQLATRPAESQSENTVGRASGFNTNEALDAPMVELRLCLKQENAPCANAALAAIHDPSILQSSEYLTLKAQTMALDHQKSQALAAIKSAIERDPAQSQSLISQGRIYDKFGDQLSAIESYLKAAKLEPRSPEPFYCLGISFFLLGERFKSPEYYERAERHFKSALELSPDYDRAEFMLGVVEVMRSRLNEAQACLRKAIQMNSSSPYYHLHYGILLRRLGDTQGALEEMRLAEKINPSYALTHLELGTLYEKLQEYPEAKKQLEAAVRLDPHLPTAYYHLRTVYLHLGLPDESKKAYEQFKLTKAYAEGEVSDPTATAISSGEIEGAQP
jgi:tetratricopeptide (TPR) repeat protein